jgi:CheY-like chemotaxis protein
MLATRLESEGYDTVVAPDGREGIKRYREGGIDLVITDIIMPEKEGMELIMELRQEFPEAKIIAVSGGVWSATDSLLYMAKQFGAKYTFAKPFEWNDLMDAVHDLLGHLENTC